MSNAHDIDQALTDPPPCYATAEEIALAERLRRKIEERYLAAQGGHDESAHPSLPLAA